MKKNYEKNFRVVYDFYTGSLMLWQALGEIKSNAGSVTEKPNRKAVSNIIRKLNNI